MAFQSPELRRGPSASDEINNTPLKYDRYQDLEENLGTEDLIQFIHQRAIENKRQLTN